MHDNGMLASYRPRLEHWRTWSHYTTLEQRFAADVDLFLTPTPYAQRQRIALSLMEIATCRKARKPVGQRAIFFMHAFILGDNGTHSLDDLIHGCVWLRRTGLSRAKMISILTVLIEATKP